MKRDLKKSTVARADQQSVDYEVGQVSGSLFPAPPTESGSLSALFRSPAPASASLLFIPAPKPVENIPEVKKQSEPAGVKGQAIQHQKKAQEKQADCQQLVDRESALHNADQQEQQKKPLKIKWRKSAVAVVNEEEEVVHPAKRPKHTPSASQEEEEEKKKKRTVFVGNLPASFTKKGLLKLFREKGAVESTRFRSVVREDPSVSLRVATIQRKVHPLKQSLNAYVVFRDEEGASRALERNGLEVEKGYTIRVDSVTENAHDHKRSVFVGNLAFELTEASLREHFEACGRVEAVRLIRDKNSGLGKGFGYILFETADSVQLALKLDGSTLEGRKVRIKRSVKKEKKKATPTTGRGGAKTVSAGRGGGAKTTSTGRGGGAKTVLAGRGGGANTASAGRGGGAKVKPTVGKGGNAAAYERRVARKTQPTRPGAFRGEMADSSKTNRKKPRKTQKKKIHI